MAPLVDRCNVLTHPQISPVDHNPVGGLVLGPVPVPVCHALNLGVISPAPDLAVPASMALAIITISRAASAEPEEAAFEAALTSDAAVADEVQLRWVDPPHGRTSALEA